MEPTIPAGMPVLRIVLSIARCPPENPSYGDATSRIYRRLTHRHRKSSNRRSRTSVRHLWLAENEGPVGRSAVFVVHLPDAHHCGSLAAAWLCVRHRLARTAPFQRADGLL